MLAAVCLLSAAAELSPASANPSATPVPSESLSIGGATINVEIEPGDLSLPRISDTGLGSAIGLRSDRVLLRVPGSKREGENRADRRGQGRTLWQDSPDRSNRGYKSWLVQVRY
jgi:hypothetical protein